MSPDEDKWPLPDYHPGPSQEHLHALGVISLTYATLQHSMDDLFLVRAARKQVPSDWAQTYYYALTEDKRCQAIREIFEDTDSAVIEAIKNIVGFFDWCRECRNNLLHAESYPSGLAPFPDGAFALTKRIKKSSKQGYIALTLGQLRAIADHMRDGVVQSARIHLFLGYVGQPRDDLAEKYRNNDKSLPGKLIIPRRMELALSPQDLRTPPVPDSSGGLAGKA
jgi:hypothetical protein